MSSRRFIVDVNEVARSSEPVAAQGQSDSMSPSDERTIRRATAQLRLADRSRTIDQVKRLYAVVMGYAVGTCFSNIYAYLSKIELSQFDKYFTVGSQVVAFITLIFIFFLGAERVLDTRYLDIRNSLPPRPGIILFDLISLGLTAFWFVVLADTVPNSSTIELEKQEHMFVRNLVVLYAIDFIILFVQLKILLRSKKQNPNDDYLRHVIKCHRGWLISNFAFFITFGLIILNDYVPLATHLPEVVNFFKTYVTSSTEFYSLSYLSILVLVSHSVRFFIDFWSAYDLYYPQLEIPYVKDLFTWT